MLVVDARTTADTHEAEVARLREAYAAWPPGVPVRLAKRTSNLFRFRDEANGANGADRADGANEANGANGANEAAKTAVAQPGGGLDVSAFGHVLRVDPERRTAWVGGMTTYEDLCD